MHAREAILAVLVAAGPLAAAASGQTTWLVSNDPGESPHFNDPRAALASPLVVSGDTLEISAGLGPYLVAALGEPIDFGTKNIIMRAQAGETPIFRETFNDFPIDPKFIVIRGGQTSATRIEGIQFEVWGYVLRAIDIVGSPVFVDCVFNDISSRDNAIHISGAGSAPVFDNCVMVGTIAGVSLIAPGAAAIRNCRFQDNFSTFSSVHMSGGGSVSDCQFINNGAFDGAVAIQVGPSGATIERCFFRHLGDSAPMVVQVSGSTTIVNCVFDRCRASIATISIDNRPITATVVNCTLAGGIGQSAMGVGSQATVEVRNSIVWGNTLSQPVFHGSGAMDVAHSIVQGGWAGTGNITLGAGATPRFTNALFGDLTIRPDSPAIDAGDNAAVPAGVTTDVAGNARFFDVPGVPNSGSGVSPIVDMGAHESQGLQTPCAPDLTITAIPGSPGYGTPDGTLSGDDFFYYLILFAGNDPAADLTTTALPLIPGYGVPNGIVNNDDFFVYLALYSQGC